DLLADEFDLGDIAETQLDDLASDFETDSDNEEEEAGKVLNGNTAAGSLSADPLHTAPGANVSDQKQPPAVGPMHVLPLYSLLPTAQQIRVFQDPPEGHRLCVVATNIAETSITIPGIRYVVDAGKVKDRKYDHTTGAQSFEVGWVSKASADQRAGRAGRTAPGHCYRLYSSAVYNDYFPLFSDPEILKMPIEGVVLQMKGMSLDNVVNFPFPTPPERTALRRAEQLLVSLDALDPNSLRITDHGKIMAMLPISPRFGRMVILGLQKDCLPYLIAIVAALSVGSPFLDMAHVLDTNDDHQALGNNDARLAADELSLSRAPTDTNQAFAEKERNKVLASRIRKAMAVFTKRSGGSDAIKMLNAVCAYEYGGGSEEFCEKYFLRPKAMLEIRKLRAQLTRLMQSHLPAIPLAIDPRLAPPSPAQLAAIQQAIVAGLIDQIALRWDLVHTEPPPPPPGAHGNGNGQWRKPSGRSCRSAAYVTMWANDPVYVHPTSAIYHSTPPDAIAYHELERSMKQLNNPNLALDIEMTEADKEKLKAAGKLWLKGNTAVQLSWLPVLGKAMCTFSKPLQFPIPRYFYSKQLQALSPEQRKQLYRGRAVSLDASGESVTTGLALDKDVMVATVNVSFGLKFWSIPQVQVQQRRIGTRVEPMPFPVVCSHAQIVLCVTRSLGDCCCHRVYAIGGSLPGRRFSGTRRAWRWPLGNGNDSYETKLSKLKASKQRHDKYLYDKIHQHLQEQLDKRTNRQTQSYQSAIGHALGNVHSILDVANKQRLRDTISQGKKDGGKVSQGTGDWAAFDTLVETEALPQGWLQNPWFSVTVISVLVMRAEYHRALMLFHYLQAKGHPLTPPVYFGALKAALQAESLSSAASTEQPPSQESLAPNSEQRTSATSVTDAIFNAIQTQGVRPGSMAQYRHVLDYHMTRHHTDSVVATWDALVSLGQPLPSGLCFRLLSYLCRVHAIKQAAGQFRRLAPDLRVSIISGPVGRSTHSHSKRLLPLPPWRIQSSPQTRHSPFTFNDGTIDPNSAMHQHHHTLFHQVQTATAFIHSGCALDAYSLLMLTLEHIYHEYSVDTSSSSHALLDHSASSTSAVTFPLALLVDMGRMLIQQHCWPLALDLVHAMAFFQVPIPLEWQADLDYDTRSHHWQLKSGYLVNDQAVTLLPLYPECIATTAFPDLDTIASPTPKSPLRHSHHNNSAPTGSSTKPVKRRLSLLDLFPSPWQRRS
ncbi:putative ATP-dependent RNA helicase DHR1, partial [Dimargaris verticillata]